MFFHVVILMTVTPGQIEDNISQRHKNISKV